MEKSKPFDKHSRISYKYQEPITRSIQLPCVRATAFSQVGLFLDLEVFSVKISVSDDLRHQAYKI